MSSNPADEQQSHTDYFRDELFTPNAVSDTVPQHNGQEPHNGNPDAVQEGQSEEELWYSTPLEGAIYQPHEASGWFLEPEPAQPHVARLGGGDAPDGCGQGAGSAHMGAPGRARQNGMGGGSYPSASSLPPPGADPFMPPASQAFPDELPPFDTPPQMGAPMQGQTSALPSRDDSAGMSPDAYSADPRLGHADGLTPIRDDWMPSDIGDNVAADFGSLPSHDEAPPPYFNPFDAQDPGNPLHADVPDDPLMPVRRMQPSRVSPPAAMATTITGLPDLTPSARRRASGASSGLPLALGDLVASSLSPAAGLSAAALGTRGKKKRKPVF